MQQSKHDCLFAQWNHANAWIVLFLIVSDGAHYERNVSSIGVKPEKNFKIHTSVQQNYFCTNPINNDVPLGTIHPNKKERL